MVFKDGDMILVDYSLFIKETEELVETTSENVAKLYKKYREGEVYEPEVVIIGEGRFVEGFEEALKNAEVGREYEVEIPPEKAYGTRDPKKVKVYSRRLFQRSNVPVEVGKEVTINDSVGRIISVQGGRVIVDFNHPLAGKTLKVKFKVLKVIEDIVEKIKYLVKRRLKRLKLDEIVVSKKDSEVAVELPSDLKLSRDIQLIKAIVARDLMKWLEGVEEVVFLDRFKKSEFEERGSG